MIRTTCRKCRCVLVDYSGQGSSAIICSRCFESTNGNVRDYEREGFELIRSEVVLKEKIEEILTTYPDVEMHFPKVLHFCAGIGHPNFSITIEMSNEDYFIDDSGQKWIKA